MTTPKISTDTTQSRSGIRQAVNPKEENTAPTIDQTVGEKQENADSSDEEEADMETPELLPEVKHAIKKLIRKEDHIKETSATLKEVRASVRECKEVVLMWMSENKVKSIDAKHGNKLIRTEKVTLNRPTAEAQSLKLKELIDLGITDPSVIMKELKECAGTRLDVKLHRRRPRKKSAKKTSSKKKKIPSEEDADEEEEEESEKHHHQHKRSRKDDEDDDQPTKKHEHHSSGTEKKRVHFS